MNNAVRNRAGSIMLMTVAFGVFLLSMTALVTDVGYLYYNQARLQTAVNAGWKAGYDKMVEIKGKGSPILSTSEQQTVRQHILEVIKSNGYTDEQLADLEVVFEDNNHITVRSNQQVGLFFARIMNIQSAGISADRANQPGDAGSIVPIGMPHGPTKDVSPTKYRCDLFEPNETFGKGREYILKLGEDKLKPSGDVAPWGVVPLAMNEDFGYSIGTEYIIKQSPATDPLSPGNFGCLDLDGSQGGGANDYEDRIKNGFPGTINVGDLIYPETGNMAKPTIRGVQYRLDNGLVNMQIPVVSGFGNGQSKQVEIIGFLNFRLTGHGLINGEKGENDKATVRAVYTGLVDPVDGKLKKNFGRIDPDNVATNTSQFVENFQYGFNAPVDLSQMLLPENGNAATQTAEAVSYRLDPTNPTGATRTVILPITEVPGEIGANNPENLNAETIYDLDAKDNPGGVYNLGDYAFGSSVRIIGFAEFEIIPPDEYTRVGTNYDNGDAGDLGPVFPGQVRGKFLRYIIEPGTIPLN